MAALARPFRFDSGDYPARRLHPLSKLAALLALSLAVSAAAGATLPAVALCASGALASAGSFRNGLAEGLRGLARDARFLAPLAVFVALFRVLDPWGERLLQPAELPGAALYMLRMVLLFALAEAYFRSTTSEELASAASAAARRVTRRGDIDPGIYLSLAVGFIPRCFEAYGRSREAALVRGFGGRRGRRPSLRSSLLVLESFVVGCVKAAIATAEALEARGYTPSRSLPERRLRAADAALAAASGGIALLCLIA